MYRSTRVQERKQMRDFYKHSENKGLADRPVYGLNLWFKILNFLNLIQSQKNIISRLLSTAINHNRLKIYLLI